LASKEGSIVSSGDLQTTNLFKVAIEGIVHDQAELTII
jgi:hypothetical protein